MAWYKLVTVFLAALVASQTVVAEPLSGDALRARFPHGIPWRIEILSLNGKSQGVLEMLAWFKNGRFRVTQAQRSHPLWQEGEDGFPA